MRVVKKSVFFFFFLSILVCPLGIYILTKSLIPLLEKSADPRVVSLRDTSQNLLLKLKNVIKMFKEWRIEAFLNMIIILMNS